MSDEPEIYVYDFSDDPRAAEFRERHDRLRVEARRRYREHLMSALDLRGVAGDVETIADIALEALTDWSDVDTREPCYCGCHPRLPESDLHDFGFGCSCQKPAEERRRERKKWFDERRDHWESPEGRAEAEARRTEEADLQTWLAAHPGVAVTKYGGWTPEQWEGEVDGHTFYFRERHDDWRIELDLRPNGHGAKALRGTDDDGQPVMEDVEHRSGDVIANGTTWDDGYGSTPVERAAFIVGVIRGHLRRETCELHRQGFDSLAVILGDGIRWCPACGTKLGE